MPLPRVLPEWAYPSPGLLLASLLLAHVLDYAYPYHSGFLLSIHPVHTAFVAAKKLAPPRSSRIRGVVAWLVVVSGHLGLYSLLLYTAYLASPWAWVLAAAWVLKTSFSLRLLLESVAQVAEHLEAGRLNEAQRVAQGLVRRNVYVLGPGHVASAALESLSESLVDGYTSPLLYAALLGPLGALFQRIVNTLDGALGFKTPEYLEAGWLSAKMDTVVNYAPARLTALLLVLLSPLIGGDPGRAYSVWRRYSGVTESVNAGHPMSSLAGALGAVLEKPGHYRLGQGGLPSATDIRRGVRLVALAALLWLCAVAALLALAMALR